MTARHSLVHARRETGASLIEVVVASVTSAVALLGIYGLIISAGRSFGLIESRLETQQSTRAVIDRIVEETRWGDAVLADVRCRPTLLCPDRLILHIPSANPLRAGSDYTVEFSLDRAAGNVIRTQGRDVGVLGGGFGAVTFRFYTAQGTIAPGPAEVARVEVSVTAVARSGRAIRQPLQTDVALRNLRPGAGASLLAARPDPPAVAPTPLVLSRPPARAAKPSPSSVRLRASATEPVVTDDRAGADPGVGAAPPTTPRPRASTAAIVKPARPAPSPTRAPLGAARKAPAPPPDSGWPVVTTRPSGAAPPPVRRAVSSPPASRQTAKPVAVLYVVQVRVLATHWAATELSTRLRRVGLAPYIVPVGSGFAVRLGAFRERPRADRILAQARAAGFAASIVTISR